MNNNIFIILTSLLTVFLFGCSQIRDSAGVNRKVIDEYTVINNPPLALPPDYNVLPSDEIISKKKIQKEDELTKEILLGLDENSNRKDESIESSALNSILNKSGATETSSNIRDEIDLLYANMSSTKGVFSGEKYMDDEEILDAAKESERIRNNVFNNKSILEGSVPITTRPKKRESLLKKLF
tara:strand:+ start:319 stop:867 length:549 start_codon:yes stop_codon:yes gene_type:complete